MSGSTADVISVAQFQQLMAADSNLRVLDVRTGAEFEGVHIEGSYNVPLDTLAEHAADLAAVDRPVVLICKTGGRATAAHAHLAGAGKIGLHILEGGIDGWIAAGGDVISRPNDRWALDRQVRGVAGSLILAFFALGLIFPGTHWLAAAIGFGLFFSAVTNTCAMGMVLSKLPYNQTDRCNIAGVLSDMNRPGATIDLTDRTVTAS